MVRKRNIWVSPREDGEWEVQREGAKRPSKVTERQADAERAAREMGQRDGVEVIVQGRDGRIRSKDSYGSDPLPPRDTEH